MPNLSVFCITQTREQADRIVDQLKAAGFSNRAISVLLPDKSGPTGGLPPASTGAPVTVKPGVPLPGALAWVPDGGVLTIPGFGLFLGGGPVLAALANPAFATPLGVITGGLVGLDIPELEAKRYEGKIREGSLLLAAHNLTVEDINRVKAIFGKAQAQNICSTGVGSTSAETRSEIRKNRPVVAVEAVDVAADPASFPSTTIVATA